MIFKEMPVTVDSKKVWRRLGRRGTEMPGKNLSSLFEDEYKAALGEIQINGVLEKFIVAERSEDSMYLELRLDSGEIKNTLDIRSRDVATLMYDCNEIYVLAVTAGDRISARISSLSTDGENSRAMIADAVASEVVEEAAKMLTRYIEREANRPITKRYSPGYGDWTLEAQREIRRAIPLNIIGITISPSFIMKPEKSITAIVGVKEK